MKKVVYTYRNKIESPAVESTPRVIRCMAWSYASQAKGKRLAGKDKSGLKPV